MQNTLKKRIMLRVYAIWLVRKVSPVAAELSGFALLVALGLKYVSPINILINSISATSNAGSIREFFLFYVRAFSNLSAGAELALIATAILGIIILRDVWIQMNRLITLRQKLILSS